MISEEDKQRVLEAQKCDDCLNWHHICHAECCNAVFIDMSPVELTKPGRFILVPGHCNHDEVWYYKLRGVPYHHGFLKFAKAKCRPNGNGIIYIRPCSMLDNMKCKGHGKKKPQLCEYLTMDTAREMKGCRLTPNCLYKYKVMGEDLNDKKED